MHAYILFNLFDDVIVITIYNFLFKSEKVVEGKDKYKKYNILRIKRAFFIMFYISISKFSLLRW